MLVPRGMRSIQSRAPRKFAGEETGVTGPWRPGLGRSHFPYAFHCHIIYHIQEFICWLYDKPSLGKRRFSLKFGSLEQTFRKGSYCRAYPRCGRMPQSVRSNTRVESCEPRTEIYNLVPELKRTGPPKIEAVRVPDDIKSQPEWLPEPLAWYATLQELFNFSLFVDEGEGAFSVIAESYSLKLNQISL